MNRKSTGTARWSEPVLSRVEPSGDDAGPPPGQASAGGRWTLFPRGVRLRHFIVLPAVGMGLAVALFRGVDRLVGEDLGPLGADIYGVARAVTISVAMASLIAWLAFRHRREYEARIQARNQALEATRDFLSRIIDGSGEAVVTLDPEWRVTSWNRAAEEIYGWRARDMLGQNVRRLFPDDASAAREMERCEAMLRAGKTVRDLETERVRQDGSRITVHITRAPLFDRSGAYLGSTGIVRNVTDLKKMEARLFEKERLAAVGELSARLAHEVRNPLAGIRGACEILSEGRPESDSLREIAGEVLHQVDRLNATVEDLLLFARPRAPDPLPTDVHEVLDHALSNLADDGRTRSVTVERRYDPDLPTLDVDPQQMEQVFLNLLQNAAQAMDYNGTVTVATSRNANEVRIVVRDSGPGVAGEVVDKLFDPFVTTRTKGTGLGLAIVKNIVQAHGGAIHVQSPRGGGAEFTVTLPLPESVSDS